MVLLLCFILFKFLIDYVLLQTVMDVENESDFREHSFGLGPEEEGVAKVLVNNAVYAGRKLSTDSRVPGRIGRPEFYDVWKNDL